MSPHLQPLCLVLPAADKASQMPLAAIRARKMSLMRTMSWRRQQSQIRLPRQRAAALRSCPMQGAISTHLRLCIPLPQSNSCPPSASPLPAACTSARAHVLSSHSRHVNQAAACAQLPALYGCASSNHVGRAGWTPIVVPSKLLTHVCHCTLACLSSTLMMTLLSMLTGHCEACQEGTSIHPGSPD